MRASKASRGVLAFTRGFCVRWSFTVPAGPTSCQHQIKISPSQAQLLLPGKRIKDDERHQVLSVF